MAEPNLNVEFSAVTDDKGKFRRLAKLLGLADGDHARGRCEHLWIACTRRGEIDLPMWLVEDVLGEGGAAALVEAELARWAGGRGDSKTRRLRIAGARRHCSWMAAKSEQSSNGGERRAKTASRVGGKFAKNRTSPNQPSDPNSDPDPKEERESSRAIPSTPVDGGQHGSGQPVPRATQQGAATPGHGPSDQAPRARADLDLAAGNVAEPQIGPTHDRADLPPSAGNSPTAVSLEVYDHTSPRALGRLAETAYRRVSDARMAMAAELKLPTPIPFPLITPGSEPRGFNELRQRIREEGAAAPGICDRVLANLIAQAREERSIDWLAEQVFGDKAWPKAKDWTPGAAARRRGPARGDPLPPAPPKPRAERPKPDLVLSDEDRAARDELAARLLRGNPDEVAADEFANGRVPAHLATAKLVRMFGAGGERAPPAPVDRDTDAETDEDTDDKETA